MVCDQLFLKDERLEYNRMENTVHKTSKFNCLFEICVVVICTLLVCDIYI